MSQPTTPEPQRPPATTLRAGRVLVSKAFSAFALAATLFGLVVLSIFCLTLAADVIRWFQVMPPAVRARNEAMRREAEDARAALAALQERRLRIDQKRAAIEAELQQELRAAPASEHARLRREYAEKVLPRGLGYEEKLLQETLFKDKRLIEEEFAQLDREMAQELKQAPPEKHLEIRDEYATRFRPRKLADVEKSLPERARLDEQLRTDTSALGVLVYFLTAGPSGAPEDAGIRPALLGSLLVVVLAILVALPVGVGAAVYLEEYSSRTLLAQVIQVNINNLAGVPSVMYGILGAFVFVTLVFQPIDKYQADLLDRIASGELAGPSNLGESLLLLLPRLVARNTLGGGLTLALLTLPMIIVASQEAIRAVPSSLRAGAHALGATKWQVTWHVVLPPALPGVLTGVILAISRAIGEAAPLILFGALLVVDQNPGPFTRFTVVPMQIYSMAEEPYELSRYNAALASAILVGLLLLLNASAIYLRQRFGRGMKW